MQSPRTLEELVITATRVATDLQETPMSVKAFTGGQLELAGIDAGRDLGIMVPNVVINPGPFGERFTTTRIRGLPGVTTYIDGIWIDNVGFLQRSFIELERVEVLRGPQGTLFGRNTNGGAVQIVTRRPADDFGARLDVELGEFDHRTLKVGVDAPLGERVKTKWTAASDRSKGFMPSLTAPLSLGDQNNSLLRGDVLWAPSDRFSLRFNVNKEDRHGSPARMVRISNSDNVSYIAYNVLAGNPQYLTQARSIDPTFPDPPFQLSVNRFSAPSHQQGYPGGDVGRWETRTDKALPTDVDQRYGILTLNWQIGDRFSLESLTSNVRTDSSQTNAYSGSELDDFVEMFRAKTEWSTQELRLIGNHLDGRLQSFVGLYYQDLENWGRGAAWSHWEFAIPNTGPNPGTPGPPGTGGRPQQNLAAVNYVRSWGAAVGNAAAANFSPATFLTLDRLSLAEDTDRALFGQLKIALNEKVDLTFGLRFTGDDGAIKDYLPAGAFRPLEPGTIAPGDPHAAAGFITEAHRPDSGTASTPKISVAYRPTDDVYVYASYAEGFASSIVENNAVLGPIILDPEVVKTRELGVRSDWLESRLRFNATLFDSRWASFRVPKFIEIDDPSTPGQPLLVRVPTDDGLAQATGLELELYYVAGKRWQVDFSLGLLDTEYVDIGDPPANGSGLQPGTPFQYAPETSYTVGLRYGFPMEHGGTLLFAGNYGWMDEYERSSASQNQTRNPDGTARPEPAYGILNARVVYRPPNRDWQLSLFGTNLTDEWYVNGGFDSGLSSGIDFGTIGRPREVGIGFRLALD